MKARSNTIHVIAYVIISVLLLTLGGIFIFSNEGTNQNVICGETVMGYSMSPTLNNGENVCIEYDMFENLQVLRGDIVVYSFQTLRETFIKRVIGLPGDKVVFGKDGEIYINDIRIQEPYLTSDVSFYVSRQMSLLLAQLENYNQIIPDDMALVLGDNRKGSFDSMQFGLIPLEYIQGKLVDS